MCSPGTTRLVPVSRTSSPVNEAACAGSAGSARSAMDARVSPALTMYSWPCAGAAWASGNLRAGRNAHHGFRDPGRDADRGPAWVAANRVAGCVLGGAYGLLWMGFVGDAFAVWIALLFGGLYVSCYVKEREGEASYTGHQAAVAIIMSMVQGLAPSPDILPAIERLVGMIGGIAVVIIAQAAAAPLVSRAISPILGSGRDAMRDPLRSGEGERRGVPRRGDLA